MADPIFTATQPDSTTILDTAPNPPKPEALRSLASKLGAKFTMYEADRRLAELKWARNARQYLGIYDPEVDKSIPANRSRAYPKMTRVKCVSMLSRLMNLLFPTDDKNWTINPSAVPNLEQEDLQRILDSLVPPPSPMAGMSAPGAAPAPPPAPPSDEDIEAAILAFAKKRAGALEKEIEDQLQELGGSRATDYVSLCRKVLSSGIQYGCGVLKGPFVEEEKVRTWQPDATGRMQAIEKTVFRPRFEHIHLWEYYADMSAKVIPQMEGQFLRKVLSKHQLVMLKERPDFFASQIDVVLSTLSTGNYCRKAYETELRAEGVQMNSQDVARGKYEAIVWHGYVMGKDLAECGIKVAAKDMERDLRAEVWMVGTYVIKAMLDPWSTLDTDGTMNQFHHFIFEEDETFLLGNALPNIMRDSQMGVCAATRITLDNAAVGRVFEMNVGLLSANNDITSINPDKIFYREDIDPATVNVPAVRTIELPSKLNETEKLISIFQSFADQETFVNAATGGDMQRGPSEPFRTATGASMLRGDAALPFKDVVRNFDIFTESVIGAIINFNRVFNPDPKLRGDFKPIARGATSLIAKEVLGMQLDNLAATLTDEEKRYIKPHALLRERVRVRDMVVDNIVMTDSEAAEADRRAGEAQAKQEQQNEQMVAAQVQEISSQVAKNLSQAGKNKASADVQTAGVAMDAMQMGVDVRQQETENELARDAGAGAGAEGNNKGVPGGPGNGGSAKTAAASPSGPGSEPSSMPSR